MYPSTDIARLEFSYGLLVQAGGSASAASAIASFRSLPRLILAVLRVGWAASGAMSSGCS
jgi:hypothetical protein